MKNEILSLKSLYRFLVISDYPIFSEGIINKNNHTGLTLTKFWQDNLLIDFRKHKCGKIIWRVEGGRNRYISEICNRSERLRFYGEYAEEIYSEAKPETVSRQIRQFASFLLGRQFDFNAFMKKLPAYLKLLVKDDEAFSKEAEAFFNQNIKRQGRFTGKHSTEQAFLCGWILTFLMFHALSGNGEGEAALCRLRNNPSLSFEELEKGFLQGNEKKQEQVVFLSGKNTELCSTPLDVRHFFGREEELFELREMLEKGGRYLVSGIGGIGKTELMRQFIKCCEEETLTEYICVVQYENSLVDSLVKAFPQIHGRSREENFNEALAIIRMHAGERILIVIDNMNHDQDEDEDIKILSKIPATIFVTSRYQKISGFEAYPIRPISKKAGSLVFRDNYRKPLQKEDKQALEVILNNELWCHTLTLRLLGSVAGSRDWDLQELLRQLEKGASVVGLEKQDGYKGLRQLYRQMYVLSGLPDELTMILRIFAALPYASYTLDFVQQFLSGYLKDDTDMQKSMEQLWKSGWLEFRESGYSMHPFVAECVAGISLNEADVVPYFESVIAALEKNWDADEREEYGQFSGCNVIKDMEWELQQAVLTVWVIAKGISAKWQERFLQLICFSAQLEHYVCGLSKEVLQLLLAVYSGSREISGNLKMAFCAVLLAHGYDKTEEIEQEYKRQLSNPQISARLKLRVASELSTQFFLKGNQEKAEEMAKYVYEKGDMPFYRMAGCRNLSSAKLLNGDIEGFGEWVEKGVKLGKSAGYEKTEEIVVLLGQLCAYYLAVQKLNEAEATLKEMKEPVEEKRSIHLKYQQLFYQGSLELNRGDEGYGVSTLREACRYAEALYAETAQVQDYALALGELAVACNKAGHRKEASMYYKKVLAVYETLPGREFDIHRVLNNMGVMYLDWGKPEEALEYLTQSWEIGKNMGGLPAAENANNLSRTWRMLGDREKELFYLQEAAPVLEQFYGSEHPKVVDAKRRLTE